MAQLLAESLLLAAAGCFAGLLVARALRVLLPTYLPPGTEPCQCPWISTCSRSR